jgi:hypothetical protein
MEGEQRQRLNIVMKRPTGGLGLKWEHIKPSQREFGLSGGQSENRTSISITCGASGGAVRDRERKRVCRSKCR